MQEAFPAERSILAKEEMKGRSSVHFFFPQAGVLSRTDVLPLVTLVASGKGIVVPGGVQSTKTKAPSSGSAPAAPRYPPLAGLSPRTHAPRASAAQGSSGFQAPVFRGSDSILVQLQNHLFPKGSCLPPAHPPVLHSTLALGLVTERLGGK